MSVLPAELLGQMDAWWRAANYLSVGQVYLLDNPLLRRPLAQSDVKPRLLGHWGTTPGLNFVYVHLNRLIRACGLDMIFIAGPGHGAPGLIANAYLEGTYSELYPEVSRDEAGLRRLLRQFSFPGGIPSHAAPETPGSIHEGGELGYSLSHAFGAVFDNPGLIAACVVGDGEAETGPLAASWHSNKFLDPASDGAVLPVLHLNGYKIANPTVLARITEQELLALLEGYGWAPVLVGSAEGMDGSAADASPMHQAMAAALDDAVQAIRDIQRGARHAGRTERPRWPMIVLRSPKGWTGPKEVDGEKVEGFWRAHQVPFQVGHNPDHLALLEQWLRSYGPEKLFGPEGQVTADILAIAPTGDARMSANPHTNGGAYRPLRLPSFEDHAIDVPRPGAVSRLGDDGDGRLPARRSARQRGGPELSRAGSGRDDEQSSAGGSGRVAAQLECAHPPVGHASRPGRPGHGGAERAHHPRLARGLPTDRAARPVQLLRGVHPHRRLDGQSARQMAQDGSRSPVAAAACLAELPAHVACVAAGS